MNPDPKLGMNTSVLGLPLTEVEDVIESVWWAWKRFSEATTLTSQGDAANALGNAVSDLGTWHSSFDVDRGVIWNEDDLEDFYLDRMSTDDE